MKKKGGGGGGRGEKGREERAIRQNKRLTQERNDKRKWAAKARAMPGAM